MREKICKFQCLLIIHLNILFRMIRGTDGKLYYTDAVNGSSVALGGISQLPDRNIYIEENKVQV